MSNKEEYIYAGIPTFMGGDIIRNEKLSGYDVVFLGIPCDYGASYRLGAKYAPRQLREYSFWDRVEGQKAYDLDHEEYLIANNLKIADAGDVFVNPTNPQANQDEITRYTYRIRKNCFPLICGGDHSITYGSFRGVNKAMKEQYPDYEIGILHFDAHLDIEKGYLNMPDVWHGNVFRKLIDDGYLDGRNLYSFGVRGIIDQEWIEYSKQKRINVYTANNIRYDGIKNIMNDIVVRNRNKKIHFYVSFDIDCIDMAYIFGTGTPQSNGLTPYEVNEALRELRSLSICGFDIVELNPKLDSSQSSFVIACELLYHFFAFYYRKES